MDAENSLKIIIFHFTSVKVFIISINLLYWCLIYYFIILLKKTKSHSRILRSDLDYAVSCPVLCPETKFKNFTYFYLKISNISNFSRTKFYFYFKICLKISHLSCIFFKVKLSEKSFIFGFLGFKGF